MRGRCESAAPEAPCVQVCAAVHLSILTDQIPSKRRDVESKCYFFSGYVWPPSIVVENWSAVALPATSCSPSRKIRSVGVHSRGICLIDLILTALLLHSLTQEYVVMNLDSRLLSFPLYVCCNFLYTSPHSDQRPDSSEQESAALVS